MAILINITDFGPTDLRDGFPSHLSQHLLPEAQSFHIQGTYGTICLQEIATPKFLFRHFLFSLQQSLSFYVSEFGQPIQTLLSLQGKFEHKLTGQAPVNFKDKEYLMFSTAGEQTITTAHAAPLSSLLNIQYPPGAYTEFFPLFQAFKTDMKKAFQKPRYFIFPPRVARHSAHDAVNAIWHDKYIAALQKKHVELRLETAFFTLLAQTYSSTTTHPASPLEHSKAAAAHEIILREIRKHLTLEEIAAELICSPSWLKKAYSKVYGIGMFHFLRKTRMEKARDMLLKGASLKAVAIEVGMKPRNFPKEFKAYFCYTVTDLKKGRM